MRSEPPTRQPGNPIADRHRELAELLARLVAARWRQLHADCRPDAPPRLAEVTRQDA